MTAAAVTTLGGGLASAGTAAAETAPLTAKAPPTAPGAAPTPGFLAAEDSLKVADNWCMVPLQWSRPLSQGLLPTQGRICDDHAADDGAGDGIHVLSNMCVVPLSLAGALGSGPPTVPCSASAGEPGFELLRNDSVAGVQTTF